MSLPAVHAAALVRSKLFVPGSRPELFSKAMAGAADALSFDLEDSVLPQAKAQARSAVAGYLQSIATDTTKLRIVRVNSSAELFAEDVRAVTVPGLDVLNLPKVEQRDDILRLADALEQEEHRKGITTTVGILANIETARGVRLAFDIASSHSRVVGLQLGFLDLSTQCNFESGNTAALNAVRLAVRLAASDAGIAAFDGAHGNVKDPDSFCAEAAGARALGMNGKSCIHPTQVVLANQVFSPSARQLAEAAAIVQAAKIHAAEGTGAFLLDGRMVDVPVIEQARKLLQRAEQYKPSEEAAS